MPSIFQKFIRGAAETGSKLYFDQAMQEMQSDLISKRDKTLEGYKQEAAKTRFKREKELLGLKTKEKTTPNITNVRALVTSGLVPDEKSAWDLLLGKKQDLEGTLFSAMHKNQLASDVRAGEPGHVDAVNMYKFAIEKAVELKNLRRGIVTPEIIPELELETKPKLEPERGFIPSFTGAPGLIPTDAKPGSEPERGFVPSFTGAPILAPKEPQTQSEFDALPSGALYIDPDDGKTYRKP